MALKPVVRLASVTINPNLPGGAGSAEGIVINAAIDTVTTVRVILHRAKGRVVRPLSSDMLKAMTAAQQARFQAKTEPDTTIVAEDGQGGMLTFKGFSVAPVLSQSKTTNEESINVVGTDALLNGLGLSIYGSRTDQFRQETTGSEYTDTPNNKTGNIAQMIREITEVLVGNLQATIDEADVESFKKLLALKHAANAPALAAWYQVLRNSDVKYPEWKAPFEAHPRLPQAAAERVKEMLQQRSESFWGNIAGLSAEFQFFYKPKIDGTPGAFVRADTKTVAASKTLPLAATRFTATDGAPQLLPLAGVILYGPTVPGFRLEEDTPSGSTGTIVGSYPELPGVGYYYEGSPPSWLAAGGDFETFVSPPPPAANLVQAVKNFDPELYVAKLAAAANRFLKTDTLISTMLQAYAKVIYDDMRLADSTATLEIPLDFSVEVGTRYTFSLAGGGRFSGFVRAVQHSLQLSGGNTLQSGTSLTLTHIEY